MKIVRRTLMRCIRCIERSAFVADSHAFVYNLNAPGYVRMNLLEPHRIPNNDGATERPRVPSQS